jgi:transcriptional regulator with XRE-family HTH domain
VSSTQPTCQIQAATTFQDLLRELRARSGLSYHQFAARSCTDASYIMQLEKGEKNKPSRDVMLRLGVGLNLDVETINELVCAAGHLSILNVRRRK